MLNAPSDSTEDSQGRQLRVSKKLSKAISSIPRSRFQKPRPNLPGSKRPVPVAARKSVETVQNKNDSSTSELKTNGASQEIENRNTTASSSVCTPSKADIEILGVNETSQKVESESNSLLNAGVFLVKEVDNTPNLSTNETLAKEDENDILNKDELLEKENGQTIITDETLHGVDNGNSSILSTDIAPKEENRQSPILKANELLEKENGKTIITEEKNKNEESTLILNTAKETVQEEDSISTTVLSAESLPDPPEQERNDTANVPLSITDRSSKYPHLTSILLSKKRTEPKKEVQHKRRKKFKKGDAAPERSKMTMADLIYWNPTNTDKPTMKSSTSVEVPQNSTTVEEEECVDGNVAENNIYDSVPKLVISEDGQINIDETSLIVSRNIPQPIVTEVIGKDETTYSSFRKRPLTKHWSPKDTTIFYKALSLVGTDFGLMEKIFPHRTRRELKQKFKREEKYNIDLINRAMYESQLTFDANTLEDLIEHLNNLPDDGSENVNNFEAPVKAKKKNGRPKTAKKAKSANTESIDFAIESLPNEAVNKIREGNKRKRKTKKLPEDFLDLDDIENIMELDSGETNSVKNETVENDKKKGKANPQPGDLIDTGVLNEFAEIVCSKTSENDEYVEVTVTKNTEASQGDNEMTDCIPVEFIEDINSVTDSTLLNNVMAYEVVTSQTGASKRKNHTAKIFHKNQTFIPLVLSSTNYTPA